MIFVWIRPQGYYIIAIWFNFKFGLDRRHQCRLLNEGKPVTRQHQTQSRQSGRLFLQSSELGPPLLTPRRVCLPPTPPLVPEEGGHTRLRERGGGSNADLGDRPCSTLSIYVLYFVAPGLWEMLFIMYSCSPITFFIVRTAIVVYTVHT
jgi:hypothetical protein